jgi:chaperonin GroES
MSINVMPLGDHVLVEPMERETTTSLGIVLPETVKEKPQKGTVLAVGPGRRDDQGNRVPMDLSVDDRVLFAKYSGTEIKLGDRELLILREGDVLAVLES